MDIKAKKSLGQNFLSNPRILDKIVEAAEITKEDTILEIGPGTGNLTRKLAEKAGKVIAIEKDHRLIELVRSDLTNFGNIEIIEGDILKLNLKELQRLNLCNFKVVGNIPYYITSHLLRTIFESWPLPKLIVLTMQKEVAQRIVAKPPPKSGKTASGQAHMSLLAISVQFYSEPKIIDYVSKGNFHPIPKVDSAILKLTTYNKQLTTNAKEFFELVRLGFSSKRKKLTSNLAKKFDKNNIAKAIISLGLKDTVRAEELSLDNWLELDREIRV